MIECIILSDGNTIIGDTDDSSNHIMIMNPITINVGIQDNNIHVFLDKYAKFTNEPISISDNHIISRYKPSDDLIKYYIQNIVPNVNRSVKDITDSVFKTVNTYH